MRVAVVAALLCFACATPSRRPPVVAPATPTHPRPPSPGEAWVDAEAGAPLLLADGRSATVRSRRVGDAQEVVLAVAGQTLPIATVAVGGVKRREVLAAVTLFPVGAETLLRVDVRLFELVAPRYFAVKTALVSVAGSEPRVVLERLVESGNDVIDRRATLTAGPDGALLVEERASGRAREVRQLRYERGPEGTFETRDPSMFHQPDP